MDFETQIRILRAYAVLGKGEKPVHYKQVMRAARVARTQVAGVDSFFVGLGLLQSVSRGMYTATKQAIDFLGKGPGEEDFSKLSSLLIESELFRFVQNLFLIHGSLSRAQFINHLLEESGEKTPSRAERALEWLERAELIGFDEQGNVTIPRTT
jgi:hypothetical protein